MKTRPDAITREIHFFDPAGALRVRASVRWLSGDTPQEVGALLLRGLRERGLTGICATYAGRARELGAKLLAGRPAASPAMPAPHLGRRVRCVTEWTHDGLPKTVEEFHD